MLIELRIENFAIIDDLELTFDSGLITFTGETGAGKSIIIDAMGTLLGSRADTTMVRTGAERAVIEGVFQIQAGVREPLHAILEREGLLDDPEYLTLGREIRRQGRSVARANGRTVTAGLLQELGAYLVDVHGQSEHLSLLRVRHHLELLDRFADVEALRQHYGEVYRRLMHVREELARLRGAERDAARRADLLSYQIDEIEAARLRPDEEEALRVERERLANAEHLATLAQEALAMMDEGTPDSPAVTDLLGQIVDALRSLARTDSSQTGQRDRAQALLDGVTELVRDVRDYQEGIEFNPKRLAVVEDRLDLIFNLKRKYGDSIQDVLAFADQARDELEDITHAEERIEALTVEEGDLLPELAERGMALSRKRKAAAEKLSESVEKELTDLRMDSARFQVDFRMRDEQGGAPLPDGRSVAFDATGLDQVEYMVAPNPGEGFKPLVKIASGGETSRLMLALKNVLARADRTPTLIFDEIDQGIGGRVGTVVGHKLWSLAREHQVLCVTHLPQLAAYGRQHYRVLKHVEEGRTVTQTELLGPETRINELAQMLGDVSDGTLQSARDILRLVEENT
jgi:DNA repair protein RecN (Recombination protein N)